jgi:hypothetical protein
MPTEEPSLVLTLVAFSAACMAAAGPLCLMATSRLLLFLHSQRTHLLLRMLHA